MVVGVMVVVVVFWGFGAWGCFQVARTVKGMDCKFEAQVQVNMEKLGAMLQVLIL